MSILTVYGSNGFDMSGGIIPTFDTAQVLVRTSSEITISYVDFEGDHCVDSYTGYGLTYDSAGQPVSGVITGETWRVEGAVFYTLTGLNLDVATLTTAVEGGIAQELAYIFRGDDFMTGGGAQDVLFGAGGSDTIYGGGGDDMIYGVVGSNYLRGDDGNDLVVGGTGFDDINGNVGNDTANGGMGNDWVVGGKDNDLLNGEDGDDIVYGNLGDDTCVGGAGADIVRGGQQNDTLSGGAGNDWLSGDRGNDTMSGGAGADIFHTFGDAGIDRVTDFSRAEGDRVQLDPGTTYSAAQSGSDVVVSMGGGGQMVLVGVQLSSLTGDWIFGA